MLTSYYKVVFIHFEKYIHLEKGKKLFIVLSI